MKKIFLLFETDLQKSTRSRVFLGAFSSEENAISEFKKNDKFSNSTEMVIIEAEIDKYEEQ